MSSRNIFKKASTQPSPALLEYVERQFDEDRLIDLIETDDFSEFADKTVLPSAGSWERDERFYWYKDNGSNILAVAHLDSVQDDVRAQVTYTAAGPLVTSGALDDRLGAYVILDLLPRLGVTCDILLTTDEEIARSTAVEFAADYTGGTGGKQYNWIIEFDRGGTDVVMYQYETGEYAAMVEDAGAQVGQGSYSDIADLDELGCAAFNWGVGYQDYHSARSHAWLRDTFKSVARFLKFHSANAETYLPHEPGRDRFGGWGSSSGWEKYYDGGDPWEADCGHMIDLDDDRTYVDKPGGDTVCVACADKVGAA